VLGDRHPNLLGIENRLEGSNQFVKTMLKRQPKSYLSMFKGERCLRSGLGIIVVVQTFANLIGGHQRD
jgi:hypothetical protein